MDTVVIIVCSFVAVICIFAVSRPLTMVRDNLAKIDTKKRQLTETKEQILSSLRELEFDLQLNKLHREEYEPLRKDLENNALEIIEQLDNLEQQNTIIDNDLFRQLESEVNQISKVSSIQINQTKNLPRASKFCSECGNKRFDTDKYCTQCGNAFRENI